MIDLRSDTVTLPTRAMREAMASAVVGDDVYRDDPTVNALEALAAKTLGKEAALFTPTGTMSNQLAILVHTQRGDEIILDRAGHIFQHEVGAPAMLAGVSMHALDFPGGMYAADLIEGAIRSSDIHEPPTSLICLENSLSNGRVAPLALMGEIYDLAKRHALAVHLDGARVFNAAAALTAPVTEITQYADTVSCCLSKGLCAPVGTMLAGPTRLIEHARKYRKMLGGGMRQAGILAAAGILALEDMPKRLIEDHENARYMAGLLAGLQGVMVDEALVETNMVFFRLDRPRQVLNELPRCLLDEGVKINGHNGGVFRFVTSAAVTRADIDRAIDVFRRVIDA